MDLIDGRCLVYDLIYNPSPTLLLKQAAEGGATTKNGLAMLYRQAELSWELFRS
jgi:shikimate dehydrogenase